MKYIFTLILSLILISCNAQPKYKEISYTVYEVELFNYEVDGSEKHQLVDTEIKLSEDNDSTKIIRIIGVDPSFTGVTLRVTSKPFTSYFLNRGVIKYEVIANNKRKYNFFIYFREDEITSFGLGDEDALLIYYIELNNYL